MAGLAPVSIEYTLIAAGFGLGLVLGHELDRGCRSFRSRPAGLAGTLLGLAVIVLLWFGVGGALPQGGPGADVVIYLAAAAIGAWVMAGAPALFCRLGLYGGAVPEPSSSWTTTPEQMGAGRVQAWMGLMGSRIAQIAERIEDDEVERLLAAIRGARRVFVMGAGRSGLVAKAFAMRLMHLGLQSYVVGETITPSFGKEDVMVIFSGSGRTRTVVDIATTAKEMGGTLCVITANPTGGVATMADVVVEIESNRDPLEDDSCEFDRRQMTGEHKSFAPLGTLFETSAMVFADAIISRLMEVGHVDEGEMKTRHTNIE